MEQASKTAADETFEQDMFRQNKPSLSDDVEESPPLEEEAAPQLEANVPQPPLHRRRAFVFALVVVGVLALIALAVGLGVGLSRDNDDVDFDDVFGRIEVFCPSISVAPDDVQEWNRLGSDFYGNVQTAQLGKSVKISDDGKVLAVGSNSYLYVFDYNGTDWSLRSRIYGGHYSPDFDMSANGKYLVKSGRPIKLYDLLRQEWTQIGSPYGFNGTKVKISHDGRTIVHTGMEGDNKNASVLRYVGTSNTWEQYELSIETFGWYANYYPVVSLDLSGDGNIVSIGSDYPIIYAHKARETISGTVESWRWDGSAWKQHGEPLHLWINNEDKNYTVSHEWLFGYRLSLSSDGNRLAVWDPSQQEVRVFEMLKGNWRQMCHAIKVETPRGTSSLTSLGVYENGPRLSGDGSALCMHYSDLRESSFDQVAVFQFNGRDWFQQRSLLTTEEDNVFGAACSLSYDGRVLAVGASESDENGYASGSIRVYESNEKP